MKPIFKEEIEFLKEYGIEIPENCWRKGSKIYANGYDDFPLLEFKVDELNNKINIKKSLIESIEGNKVHIKGVYNGKKLDKVIEIRSYEQEIEKHNDKLEKLLKQTIDLTTEYLNNHVDYEYLISISGGKDSTVMNYIFNNFIKDNLTNKNYKYVGFNTTNDTADTYKQMYKEGLKKEDIVNPVITFTQTDWEGNKIKIEKTMGWHQWIKDVKNYWIPNALKRSCCSTFKEGQVKRVQDINKKYVTLLGVRKHESTKRAFYEFDIKKAYELSSKKYNMPDNWERIAPICYWTDYEVWLYILREVSKGTMVINPMYYKGFNRCGCLICPYNSDYVDLLVKKYYPYLWNRWVETLKKNYEVKNVEARLKWTLEEFICGKWKTGLSKEYEIISKKKTKERVEELSKVKGISMEMAEKYWNNTCKCGKHMSPDEVGMFYKLYGRKEKETDNRQILCKECLCEDLGMDKKEYSQKIIEFRNQGCDLF